MPNYFELLGHNIRTFGRNFFKKVNDTEYKKEKKQEDINANYELSKII